MIPKITVESSCKETWKCQKIQSCSCKIPVGFGDKILENVIDWSEQTTPHKIAEKINASDPLRLEWEKLGQTVINWCLAEDPIRA